MLKSGLSIIADLHELSQSEDLQLSVVNLSDSFERILFSRKEDGEIIGKILCLVLKNAMGSDGFEVSLRKKGNVREVRVSKDSLGVSDLEEHIGDDVEYVVLRGTSLADKSRVVKTDREREIIIDKAYGDYEGWCLENGIQPHQSRVHSFADARSQARFHTIPARTRGEIYNMAYLTAIGHLYDDIVDSDGSLPRRIRDLPEGIREFQHQMRGDLRKIFLRGMSLGENGTQRKAIFASFRDVLAGALIQSATNYGEQRRYAEEFRNVVLGTVADPSLKKDLSRLHPMQLSLVNHVAVDGLFGLEQGNVNGDLAKLWGLWAAPVLYVYNAENEMKKEGFRLRYGKELDANKDGVVDDNYLIEMIDVAEEYLVKTPDPRKKEHLGEMGAAYQSLKRMVSGRVRGRYEASLKRLNRSVG